MKRDNGPRRIPPMPVPNNVNALLARFRLSEPEFGRYVRPKMAQSYINRVKNGMVCPTTRVAWKMVEGFRRATGKPISFEDVFPNPAATVAAAPVREHLTFAERLARYEAEQKRGAA